MAPPSASEDPMTWPCLRRPPQLPAIPLATGQRFWFDVKGVLRLPAEDHFDRLPIVCVECRHCSRLIEVAPQAIEVLRQSPAGMQTIGGETLRQLEEIGA